MNHLLEQAVKEMIDSGTLNSKEKVLATAVLEINKKLKDVTKTLSLSKRVEEKELRA